MSLVLVLHRREDGARVIVGGASIVEVDTPALWPYVETFDEVCDALNAQHVLDDETARARGTRRGPVEERRPARNQPARTSLNDQIAHPPREEPREEPWEEYVRRRTGFTRRVWAPETTTKETP